MRYEAEQHVRRARIEPLDPARDDVCLLVERLGRDSGSKRRPRTGSASHLFRRRAPAFAA